MLKISLGKSFRLYRECDGARELGNEINLIARQCTGCCPLAQFTRSTN